MNPNESELRAEIVRLTRELIRQRLTAAGPFVPGQQAVPYAGRVYDEEEVVAGVSSMLDFWLTLGPEGAAFERELAALLGVRRSILTNSGSSANLLAVAALTSAKLGDRRLLPGDEIITAAAGFPTTVAPIVQHRCVPVFVDSDPVTGNIDADQLHDAYVPGRTKAVLIAHMLGNPFDLAAVTQFCEERGLWLIEDNCDALGSRYGERWTGTFGDLSTQSFYPPHHLTLGEGGAVHVVREPQLKSLVESFRDWGRDCWCPSGRDNTCGRRFGWQLGELPAGYDHKYVYGHLGYNLKPLDPQAAIGRRQLAKLPQFIEARSKNWQFLRRELASVEDYFEFMLPTHARSWTPAGFTWHAGQPVVDPSWFGFMLLVRPGAPFSRTDLAQFLDARRIGHRVLFGGNLARQPAFVQLRRDFERGHLRGDGPPFRSVGDLRGADRLMQDALFVGVYPGLSPDQLHYLAESILTFCRSSTRTAAA